MTPATEQSKIVDCQRYELNDKCWTCERCGATWVGAGDAYRPANCVLRAPHSKLTVIK